MFKHILVPLDGSHLAEAALPVAAMLAQKLGAAVTLIHLIEQNAAPEVHGDRHLTSEDEACNYLDGVARVAFPAGITVTTHVHTEEVRNVARAIVAHNSEFNPDLVILCTHGNGGLRDRMVGSIAQQVIGGGTLPVLLVKPDEELSSQPISLKRFLVALDGDPEHEYGLSVAAELAIALGAGLELITIIPNVKDLKGQRAATNLLLPTVTAAMLECTEEPACEYLESLAAPWLQKGLEIQKTILRGDPAQEIAAEAARSKVDLLVLGTHGRAGTEAFWAGSLAPRITAATHLPILFVPVRRG